MKLDLNSLSDIPHIARDIVSFASDEKVWLFKGEMGVGKTTLIKGLCEYLQVTDHVSSPTFSLVNEYRTSQNEPIFHFDLYRIDNEKEAFDMGIEEYFYSEDLCFVEWPEKIPSLLPDKYLEISIILGDKNQRKINLSRK